MSEWWSSIPAFEKLFWYFALPFTLIFLVQLILTMIGIDWHDGSSFEVHDGVDIGHDADFISGFRLFTLRNFIIFFTGFGWAGIFAVHAGLGPILTIIIAFITGLFLMFAVAGMFYLITKLNESGTISLSNAVNATGRVYLPIPSRRSGTGQVQITVQGSMREIEAITDEDNLPTGTPVQVTQVINNEILLVKKSQ